MAGTRDGAASEGGSLRELTLRGILLGGAITLLFTAANVYLGLKVGLTFAAGLRSFLRQDPDVMMVGEIRDTETALIAVVRQDLRKEKVS